MDTAAKREAIAAAIRATVPEGWTVYASPPPVPAVPCVIVAPRAPYRARTTVGQERVNLRLTALVPLAAGQAGLDALDGVMDRVLPALLAVATPQVVWEQVDTVGTVVTQGGVEHIAGTADIAAYD